MWGQASCASLGKASRSRTAQRSPGPPKPELVTLAARSLKLIAVLESKPIVSVQRICQMLGVSRSQYARMRRLLDQGSSGTQRFHALGGVKFVVRLNVDVTDQEAIQKLERRLALDVAVERADRVAGAVDYQLSVRLPSLADLEPWRCALSLQPGLIAIDAKPCRSIITARSEAAAVLGYVPDSL